MGKIPSEEGSAFPVLSAEFPAKFSRNPDKAIPLSKKDPHFLCKQVEPVTKTSPARRTV